MANARGLNPRFDTVRSKRNIISGLGATRTLTASESGSLILLDRAAGIVVTLPTAVPGLTYEFFVTTTITSNTYKIITGAATELLIGSIIIENTASSNALSANNGNGSTHIAVSMPASGTQPSGGVISSRVKFTCLSTTQWFVEGVVLAGTTPSTPFATS